METWPIDRYNGVVNNRRWSPQEEGAGCSEQQVFHSVKKKGYRTSRTQGLQQGAWRLGLAGAGPTRG